MRYDKNANEVSDKRRKATLFKKVFFSEYLGERILARCFRPLYLQFLEDFPEYSTLPFSRFFEQINLSDSNIKRESRDLNTWKESCLGSAEGVKKWTQRIPRNMWELEGGIYALCFFNQFCPCLVFSIRRNDVVEAAFRESVPPYACQHF